MAGDYIVAIGDSSVGFHNSTSFFSLKDEEWLDLTIPPPDGVYTGYPTIVQLDASFLVVGGGSKDEKATDSIYEFDLENFAWVKRKEETAVATRGANVFSFEC